MNESTIRELTRLGVSLFRINLSHTRIADLPRVIRTIQAATDVPICLDSEGAQVRTGDFETSRIKVRQGQSLRIAGRPGPVHPNRIYLYPANIVKKLRVGDRISIDFHSVLVEVAEKDRQGVRARVLNGGPIGRNKAVTVERRIELPALTAKDRAAIRIGRRFGIRHFALSFANRAADVREARRALGRGFRIISKIECQNGVSNLEEILKVSDAVLIDRGDLSREEPIERIPWLQKYIIRRANKAGKKVYVATNLLESMTTSHGPTRAEVNDVINTLLDGADGLVLAAETAIGHDPVGCARMMTRLIRQFEGGMDPDAPYLPSPLRSARKFAPVFWFTGLSGSGKSTVAAATKALLEQKGLSVLTVDGDVFRGTHDLGFSEADIKKNNELIAQRCEEERERYDVILVPIISPYAESRKKARLRLAPGFYEVHFNADLDCVMARDVKGLYRKAMNNEIRNMIGFSKSNPYQPPRRADLAISSDGPTPAQSAARLCRFIEERLGKKS